MNKTSLKAQIADNLTYLVEKKAKQKRFPKTKDAIAKAAGIERTTLWRLINRKINMTEKYILGLSKALGCKPWKLLVGVDNPYDYFPNIDIPNLRRKHTYARVEGIMRSDKEIARFFGGMSKQTLKVIKHDMEKLIEWVRLRREDDMKTGKYDRKNPLY